MIINYLCNEKKNIFDSLNIKKIKEQSNSLIQKIFNYKIKNENFAKFNKDDNILDYNIYPKINLNEKVDKNGIRNNIKLDSIYSEDGMDTSLYPTNTIYDKLVDIFTQKENKYYQCPTDKKNLEDWERDLNMTLKLIQVPLIVFNRESIPTTRHFQKTDTDNTMLPLAQSAIDILNEKANKTSQITDIQDIEVLTTEEQKQYTFNVFINYPTVDNRNYPVFKNLKLKVVLVRRRLIKDDIFAPNAYDSTKFVIKSMVLIDSKDIETIPNINKGDYDYYSFKNLMTNPGEILSDEYIDKEMLRNRRKHEHEMDFRNIIIEDDNYLNDYMVPEKNCGI